MKKLLLCASLTTVFALTACDKAPEAAPATDAAKKTELLLFKLLLRKLLQLALKCRF